MISVQNIYKSFGSQNVLKDLSFEISKGSVVGFLGPNGAGKSTTMKILIGYLQADKGNLFIDSKQVLHTSEFMRSQIGYLPEHNALYTSMYIKEYLNYVAGIYKLNNKESKIKNVIDQTGLGPEQHKKIHQLSKGYRQRVGIAQAIIHDPNILILDEPTTGLDPNQIGDIRNLITELGREKTVLLSTHIMQEVEAMCERVLIMDKGTIAKDLPILNHTIPTSDVKTFKVEFDQFTSIELLNTNTYFLQTEQVGEKTFHISISPKQSPTVFFDFAVSHHLKLLQLTEHNDNLEQIFKNTTAS